MSDMSPSELINASAALMSNLMPIFLILFGLAFGIRLALLMIRVVQSRSYEPEKPKRIPPFEDEPEKPKRRAVVGLSDDGELIFRDEMPEPESMNDLFHPN